MTAQNSQSLQEILSNLRETHDQDQIKELGFQFQVTLGNIIVLKNQDGREYNLFCEEATELKNKIAPLFNQLSSTVFPRAESLRELKNVADKFDPLPSPANRLFPSAH